MWLCGNEKPVKESYELEKVRVGVRQEELRGVAGGVGVCVPMCACLCMCVGVFLDCSLFDF